MSTIIGVVILSYDIDKKHSEVKSKLLEKGYSISWNYPGQKAYILPNTTVWQKNKSTDGAIADIKGICKELGVVLEKAVAILASDFEGV